MEFLSEQKIKNISISDALLSDMEEISGKAKSLSLDCEDMNAALPRHRPKG